MLLHARHRDTESAALSVAANRASKVRLLRADEPDIAARYADDLHADVEAFIYDDYPAILPAVAERLREIVRTVNPTAIPRYLEDR